MVHKSKHNECVLRQGGRSYKKTEYPYATTGPFNFKKLLDFTSFFKDPVQLGNRTYRAWWVKIRAKNGQLNDPVRHDINC